MAVVNTVNASLAMIVVVIVVVIVNEAVNGGLNQLSRHPETPMLTRALALIAI